MSGTKLSTTVVTSMQVKLESINKSRYLTVSFKGIIAFVI